jgi:hypothetical protein
MLLRLDSSLATFRADYQALLPGAMTAVASGKST